MGHDLCPKFGPDLRWRRDIITAHFGDAPGAVVLSHFMGGGIAGRLDIERDPGNCRGSATWCVGACTGSIFSARQRRVARLPPLMRSSRLLPPNATGCLRSVAPPNWQLLALANGRISSIHVARANGRARWKIRY
jgi:hypothetical protein